MILRGDHDIEYHDIEKEENWQPRGNSSLQRLDFHLVVLTTARARV